MPIKQIQLRGISRTPSDRMAADGGCAESLNVHLDEQELAPTLPPKDVTDMVDNDGNYVFPQHGPNSGWQVVFIHKTPFYTHAISLSGVTLGMTDSDGEYAEIMRFNQTETFVRCISLGNTLGVITNERVYWLIFKDGVYSILGTDVPFPKFQFFNVEQPEAEGVVVRNIPEYSLTWYKPWWKQQHNDGDAIPDLSTNMPEIWERIKAAVNTNLSHGVFSYQQVAILAIQLFDESMLISAPIVIAPGFENPFSISVRETYSRWYTPEEGGSEDYHPGYWDDGGSYRYSAYLKTAYKLGLKINEDSNFFENWKDVVKEIRIYLSQQVAADMDETKAVVDNYRYSSVIVPQYEYEIDPDTGERIPIYVGDGENQQTNADVILDSEYPYLDKYLTGSFYLAAKYDIDSSTMRQFADGVIIDQSDLLPSDAEPGKTYNDLLATQPALVTADGALDMKHYSLLYQRALLYNNKIVASDISENMQFNPKDVGLAFSYQNSLNSYLPAPNLDGYNTWHMLSSNLAILLHITFHIRDAAGHEFDIQVSENEAAAKIWYGGDQNTYPIKDGDETRRFMRYLYGFIVCPDSRAYSATLEFGLRAYSHGEHYTEPDDVQKFTVEMQPHPFLPCSYYYGGMGTPLSKCETVTTVADYQTWPFHNIDVIPNKVYVSAQDNPFTFPIGSRFTFSGRVLGCAIATNALSPGQVGQFPMYVFTTDGIWAMEAGSDGTFLTQKPGPRDVCVNADSITSIDNAVVFVTEKGVMLISGLEVVNLSQYMNGKHFSLKTTSDEYTLINGGSWGVYSDILTEDTPFMSFAKSAQIMYDYAGARLLLFNGDKPYMYAYMMNTKTWHKTDFRLVNPGLLNSYPDCLVSTEAVNKYRGVLTIRSCTDIMRAAQTLANYGVYPSRQDAYNALVDQVTTHEPIVIDPAFVNGEGYEDFDTLMQRDGVDYTFVINRTTYKSKVLNYSTFLDDADLLSNTTNPVKGIIITRPFDLEEPDVRKTIKEIRIRGQFNRKDAQYILLGSFDGIHWQMLRSLRGGSYKLFRMIILTNLSPTERISWVDVDYESRFANKLR